LSVPLPSYAAAVRFDVVVVGAGTAGCVLAARLSEDAERRVCLLEAGPDYGPLDQGGWPRELLDARTLPATDAWSAEDADYRSLGGRLVGGSSAVNACMVVAGSPADYDEWGDAWSFTRLQPYLERARAALRTTRTNSSTPGPFHAAFIEAAHEAGFPLLDDPDDPTKPVGVAAFPANVVEGTRWNAAFAYLDRARPRPNLTIVPGTLVDRVVLDGTRAVGVIDAGGRAYEAETVLLSAGAYFSAAILLRSGVGPRDDLIRRGIEVVSDLPTGGQLLDHCGARVEWPIAPGEWTSRGDFPGPHAMVKAASASCPPGSWDLHLLSWLSRQDSGELEAGCLVFHMKPQTDGRVSLASTAPAEHPLIERGFLPRPGDVAPVAEGIELARSLAASSPLRELLGPESAPGNLDLEEYVRANVIDYFHPAGTCAIGSVVDERCRVLGIENLVVCDASVMPTIPRANTNLTTAAIAERVSELL